MSRILLIGGNGFIGRNVIPLLLKSGFDVSSLDSNSGATSAQCDTNLVTVFNASLQDIDLIESAIREHDARYVLHLASNLIPSSSTADFDAEMLDVVYPTFRVIDLCAKLGTQFFFVSSGGAIYKPSNEAVNETHALEPHSLYAQSKLLIEKQIEFSARHQGLRFTILRPSNVYGRYQRTDGKQGFIAATAKRLLINEPIEVWGYGDAVRDYIDVYDVAIAMVQLIQRGAKNDVVNLGSGQGHSVKSVIAIFEEILGRSTEVVVYPDKPAGTDYIVLDISYLRKQVKFRPRSLACGIRAYLEWLGALR